MFIRDYCPIGMSYSDEPDIVASGILHIMWTLGLLLIIWFIIHCIKTCINNYKEYGSLSAPEPPFPKTNAHMEQILLSENLKKGMKWEDAFVEKQKQIRELGFEPCLSPHDFELGTSKIRGVKTIDDFECPAVKNRREYIRNFWNKSRTTLSIMPEKIMQQQLYENYPKNQGDYNREIKLAVEIFHMKKVGDYYGSEKIESIEWMSGKIAAVYRVTCRNIETGKVITRIYDGKNVY